MTRTKKHLSIALALLLILSLTFSSIVFAEGLSTDVQPLLENSADTPAVGNDDEPPPPACSTYSSLHGKLEKQETTIPFITINGDGTATAKFKTNEDCVEASFSVYTYEGSPTPYEDQVHFASDTAKYDKAGSYELTIDMPRCGLSQFDLYAGPIQTVLNPGYGHNHLTLVNFLLYNGGVCPTPTPTPTTTPTSTSTPTTTPSTTPTSTSTPTTTPSTTPTSTTTPTTTPSTTPTSTTTPTTTPSTTPTSTSTPTTTPTPTPSESPSQPPTPSESTEPSPTPSEIIIEEEEVPIGDGKDEDGEEVIDQSTEETVPVDQLPKTGESSSMPYYLLGSFVAVTGLMTLRKRRRIEP